MNSIRSAFLIVTGIGLGLGVMTSAAWSQDVPPPLPVPAGAPTDQPPPQPAPYNAPQNGTAPAPAYGPPQPQPVYGQPPPGAVLVSPAQPTYVYPSPYGPPVYAQPPVIVVTPAPPLADYHLSATVDALFLERSVGSSIPLGFTQFNSASSLPPALPNDQLYSDDAEFPLAAGLRLELTTRLDERWSLSGMYWGLQQWSVGNTIYGDPDQETVLAYSPYLQLPGLLNGLDDSLTYKYESKIENVELNASYRLNSYDPYFELDWLVGARYVYVSDNFTLTGIDDYNSATETLSYGTSNNLIGAQTGLLLVRGWSRFQYELGFKLGLMANIYHQSGSDSASEPSGIPAGFVPYSISNNGSGLAGLFEGTFALRYRLNENLWLRLGYQVYDIAGLALAPRQLGSWGHGGNVAYDGLSIGLQATW